MTAVFTVDGQQLTVAQVARLVPHVNRITVRARLFRGMRTLQEIGGPLDPKQAARSRRPRRGREAHVPAWEPDPLNALFRGWKHTTRGRALQLLDVNHDPLRASL